MEKYVVSNFEVLAWCFQKTDISPLNVIEVRQYLIKQVPKFQIHR